MTCFEAKFVDELEPCYPDYISDNQYEQYELDVCNGMYAGINIMMSGIDIGKPVSIEVEGPHSGFKLFEMLAVPVEVNTGAKLRTQYLKNDTNPYVIRKAPFKVFDALKPIYNIFTPSCGISAINFKSIVEYNRIKNKETWLFRIKHMGQCIELSLTINVYPLTVDQAARSKHKYINWFNYDNIASYHQLDMWSDDYFKMFRKYMRAAAYSRQNTLNLPVSDCIAFEGEGIRLNEERLLKIIRIAEDEGIIYFQGNALASRYYATEDDRTFYKSIDHDELTHTDDVADLYRQKAMKDFDEGDKALSITGQVIPSQSAEEDLKRVGQLLNAFLSKHKMKENYVQCAIDEPNDQMASAYEIVSNIIRETMPNVQILEPVLETEAVVGMLDIWCPSVDIYEKNQSFYDQQIMEGNQLFVYTCLTPGGNYLNRLLDFERIRSVLLGWAPAYYDNIEGFLHWGANQYLDVNPFDRQVVMFSEQLLEFHPKKASFLPAGDYCIFYPGDRQPYISVRSEAHRIGLEDLELLYQLGEISTESKELIVNKLFRGYKDYEKSIKIYRRTRRTLLETLFALLNKD